MTKAIVLGSIEKTKPKKLVKQCKQKIMKDSFEPNEFEKLTKHLQRVTKQKRFVQGNEEVRNLMVVEELLEFYDWAN